MNVDFDHVDPLFQTIMEGDKKRIVNFKLDKLSPQRFKLVKDVWLRADPSLRVFMLLTPKEFWLPDKMLLCKDVLENSDPFFNVYTMGVRLPLTLEEFETLSLREKITCLYLVVSGSRTIHLLRCPSPESVRTLLFNAKLTGADLECIRFVSSWNRKRLQRRERERVQNGRPAFTIAV